MLCIVDKSSYAGLTLTTECIWCGLRKKPKVIMIIVTMVRRWSWYGAPMVLQKESVRSQFLLEGRTLPNQAEGNYTIQTGSQQHVGAGCGEFSR